jgi:hypothetical protein
MKVRLFKKFKTMGLGILKLVNLPSPYNAILNLNPHYLLTPKPQKLKLSQKHSLQLSQLNRKKKTRSMITTCSSPSQRAQPTTTNQPTPGISKSQ